MLGTFALWFGWYGFNPGSTLSMHDKEMGALAAQVAMSGPMIPSSTFGCTGPTGLSVLLDTGQDGWVAKHHQGEPLLGRVRELRKWRDNGRAAMVAWMEQVGISLCQRCQAGLEVDHNPYVGVRIGEAAHPGPSGGGARATDRRRQEREADGGEAGLGPLAGLLRPLIEQMLREVLQELLGGAELRNLFSSLLVGGQVGAGTSQAPRALPGAADNETQETNGRWKKRRAAGADPEPGKGKSSGGEKAAGKGKSNGDEKAAGKGKSNGGEILSGKGKSNGGEKATGKGKSNGGEILAGKGKSNGGGNSADLPDGDGGGEWTVVSRRGPRDQNAMWNLRSTDWSDPVTNYDDLVASASGAEETVRAVALVDEEQKETLTSLYRGCGKPHALLLVVLQTGPDTERCPGSVGGGALAFRQVKFTRACTPGLAPPGPKTQIKAGKVELVPSAVVYVRFVQKYLEKDVWAQALKHPQRLVLEHMARHRLKAMDSWGWAVEQTPGVAGQQQIFGKLRLPEKDVSALLATSGAPAFYEPARSVQLGPVTTEWVPLQEGETPAAYLARCLTVAAPLGLVAGRRQLGRRGPHDPQVPMQRLWLVQMVPNAVTVEQLTAVLGHAFTDVEMVFQRRRGSTKDYTFRGKSTEQGDSLAIPLQYGTDNLVLWVRHAPPKKGPAQSQEIRTSGSWSLLGPKRAFGSEPRTGVPEAGEPSTEETGMQADKQGTQPPSTATADATNKRAADASEPSAKRVAGSQRALPEGATVDHVEKDGNCLFSCLAKGINMLAPDGRQLTGGEVRARIAVHLRKNEEAYVKGWDHEMPDRTKAADWGSYVTAIEGDKVWGGLTEIKAACRVWDIRCIVFPTSEHLEPFQVHGQAKRRVVGLYFTGHHYDLLRGEAGTLPRSILDIRAAPPVVPVRGGGDPGDSGSVWTRSSRRTCPSMTSAWTAGRGRGSASQALLAPGPGPRAGSEASSRRASVWTRASSMGSGSGGRCGMRTLDAASKGGRDTELDDVEEQPGKKQRRMNHLARQPDGTYREPCSYCAHVFVSDSSVKLSHARYSHHMRWHKDLPRTQGRGLRRDFEMRELRPDEPADWRCPMCTVGVPLHFLAKVSKAVFAEVREEHRRRAHRHLTRAAYAVKLKAAAHRKPAERMKCRVRMLNRHRARTGKSGTAGTARPSPENFVAFTWPQVLRRKAVARSDKWRLTLATAWRCRSCMGCWRHAKVAVAHKCADVVDRQKAREAGLRKARKLAASIEHGIDPAILAQTFDSALEFLTRATLDP